MNERNRVCSECKIELPITAFSKADKFGNYKKQCKECVKKKRAVYLQKPYVKLRNAAYSLRIRRLHPERVELYQNITNSRNPLRHKIYYKNRDKNKVRAHVALHDAVRRGQIVKPDKCERCGNYGSINGHHEDYSKPLSVEWLCRKCHTDKHRKYPQSLIQMQYE